VTAALGAGALAAGVRGVGPVLGTGAAMVALYLGVVTVTGLDRAERARLLAALWRRREGTARATDVLLVDPSDRGGLVLYTALVAAGLADAGCAVTVVANRAVDQAACAPAARCVLPAARWGREGAGPLARCRNLARWLSAARAVAWLVLRLAPGVVHFQAPLNRRFDPLLVRLLRGIAPVVLTAHDVIPHEAAAGEERHWKRLYRAVDTVIVLTPPAARAIEQLGAPTPEVVPHPTPAVEPIDRAEARRLLDLPEQDRLLGALGFVRPYKGYGLLAEVWERLGPDAPWLLVLGELVVESEADTLARLGRCPRVILRPGYASEVELRQAVAACDAVLLPYDGGSDSGLVHLARALGVPVIASDAAPLAASVHATGAGSVVPRTVEAWAEAVLADLPSPPHPGAPLEVSGREHLAAYESARARWLA
jgi:glycosyltransferase involved in cell wall biosynthesis